MLRHLLLPTIAVAVLAASTASAVPARHCQAAAHVLPARVDAAAQAATLRGIGDRRLAR